MAQCRPADRVVGLGPRACHSSSNLKAAARPPGPASHGGPGRWEMLAAAGTVSRRRHRTDATDSDSDPEAMISSFNFAISNGQVHKLHKYFKIA